MATRPAPKNRGIVFKGPGKVAMEEIPFPSFQDMTLQTGEKRRCPHGVILKVVASNICGSDMHMVRGRTGAEPGLIFGHEITGEVFKIGDDVETLKKGDLVSVPFNVSCGRCTNCKDKNTNLCLRVNKEQPGGAYGYVQMGGWPGGQCDYVLVPYADFACLKLPKNHPEKLLDMALLSDILPTAYHGCVGAGVTTGSSVYIAGAGPVGMCAVACCKVLGSGNIIVGDYNEERLKQVAKMGCYTVNLNEDPEIIPTLKRLCGTDTVDCSVECVGYETNGHHGYSRKKPEEIAEVMNTLFKVTKPGGGIGVMGVYLPMDPGASDTKGKQGILPLEYGTAWNKGLKMMGGQCPTMRYQEPLMNAILSGRLEVAKYMDIEIISLEEAPKAYADFCEGVAKKYIIDPQGLLKTYMSQTTTA